MKKINLTPEQVNALEQHSNSGANGVKIIKAILTFYIEDLINIDNIDPKGNMGLQTLARQEAKKTLVEVRDLIFPELSEDMKKATPGAEKMSQWR